MLLNVLCCFQCKHCVLLRLNSASLSLNRLNNVKCLRTHTHAECSVLLQVTNCRKLRCTYSDHVHLIRQVFGDFFRVVYADKPSSLVIRHVQLPCSFYLRVLVCSLYCTRSDMSDQDIASIYLLSTVLHHSRLITVILWKER